MIAAPQRAASAEGDASGLAGWWLQFQRAGSGPAEGTIDERLRQRLWLVSCCLALAVLAFVTRPGNIIADTKIDLVVNPTGFLERALHLWDPSQFGQLQDQAYGYFFPIGPFFVIGKLMALPPWVIQRLWLTAVLLAAFLGVVRLSARLGIGTPATRLAAGFAYALAPRGLSLLGVLSSEFLPAAMLPWILLPLVRAVQEGRGLSRGRLIRAVAQSATALAMCSGVNAAATVAVVIPAVIYLLTAPRSAGRRRIAGWWAAAVALATAWWSVPLLLLGRFSVSILPYTESASVTTATTSLSNVLRGTEDWTTYLVVNGQPWWPVGYQISTGALSTVLTGVVAALGLTGLLRRRMPQQRFLLCVLLAGILITATGHVSGLGNPLAGPLDQLINGPLAPLRNLRKFDPMIRLPVALGLAHLLASSRLPRRATLLRLAAGAALAGLALPAYMTGTSAAGDFPGIPSYWLSTTAWLNSHAQNQAVLAVPGARFGEYVWGRPTDDVLEALFRGNWAGMQLDSIGSVGSTRLLQAIDARMAAGTGSAGLTQVLALMGVKYIVVRNDLIRPDLRGAWPARIHQALDESPGIVRVAQFGPSFGNPSPVNAVSTFDPPYPAVQIYQVMAAQPVATVQPVSGTLRVSGGPEALLALADEGILKDRPLLLNSDSPGITASQSVLTDSLRARVRNFGEIRADYSPTLTATDPAQTFEATRDYLEPGWLPYLSVARYDGIADVTASSSESDIGAIPQQSNTGGLPFAALDGDPRAMWESGSWTGPVGQWIRVDFTRGMDPRVIRVAFADSAAIGPPVTRVAVSTAAGRVTDAVRITASPQPLRVPPGASRWLTITVTRVAGAAGFPGQAGISEISVPGVSASREIVAPAGPAAGGADPAAVVLSKAEPQPSECMPTSLSWVCSPPLAKPTEEEFGFDEGFAAQRAHAASLYGTAVMTDPSLIARYAWPGRRQPHVAASSTYTSDPQDSAFAAFDGNPATSWISGTSDQRPTLSIRWARAKVIDRVTILQPPGGSSLLQVTMTGSGGQQRAGVIGAGGRLSFLPMRTDRLTLSFTASQLPVQVSEVVIPGVRPLASRGPRPVRLGCGLGPTISLNGGLVPTRAAGTVTDLLEGRPLAYSACSPVMVQAGQNRVTEPASDPAGFDIQAAVLDGGALSAHPASPSEPARTIRWTAASRSLMVDARQRSYLEVAENFNAAWQARIGGRTLAPVRLAGWEQGWLLPAGTRGLVTLTYRPDTAYRAGLFGGLAALALVLLAAAAPRRRRPMASGPTLTQAPAVPPATQRPSSARWRWLGRRSAPLAWLAGLGALSFPGLWLGGYPGLLVLPAVTGFFLAVGAFRDTSPICRRLAAPQVVLILLLVASVSGALGGLLLRRGASGPVVTVLWDVGPQLLCLIIAGRLAVALAGTYRSSVHREQPAGRLPASGSPADGQRPGGDGLAGPSDGR
jgi:arabinofuranan 3-O-arabinosyltransferase